MIVIHPIAALALLLLAPLVASCATGKPAAEERATSWYCNGREPTAPDAATAIRLAYPEARTSWNVREPFEEWRKHQTAHIKGAVWQVMSDDGRGEAIVICGGYLAWLIDGTRH